MCVGGGGGGSMPNANGTKIGKVGLLRRINPNQEVTQRTQYLINAAIAADEGLQIKGIP